jgi:tungstate transport system ATP-binding protein
MSVPLYTINDLTKDYDGKRVLNIASLRLDRGKIYCLYGGNGSGKTTLFEILTMVKKPTSGTIRFDGVEMFPGSDGIRNMRESVTLVHQNPILFDTSVGKNVAYGLRIRRVSLNRSLHMVRKCLAIVGMEEFAERRARSLSGGESQRIAIARALAISPKVIFLDEFSANIDSNSRSIIEQIIQKIKTTYQTTICFTTHSMDQAYRLADEVIHLYDGMIVPGHIQNVFRGRIEQTAEGACFQNSHLRMFVVSPISGMSTIAIPVNAITVSRSPLASSMRNSLKGRLAQIIDDGTALILRIDAGEIIEAQVTRESYQTMGLEPGQQVFVSFKASSVTVL